MLTILNTGICLDLMKLIVDKAGFNLADIG